MTTRNNSPASLRTFGEVFPTGAAIDLLRGSRLLLWDCTKATIAAEVEHEGTTYRPKDLRGWKSVSLPASFAHPPEPKELIHDLEQTLTACGLEQTGARLAAFVVLSTWFADVLPWVPSLIAHGPVEEVLQALQALTHLCRRGIFLQRANARVLDSIPQTLWPTVVLAGPTLNHGAEESLRASNRRLDCPVKGALLYPRVLYCSDKNLSPWLSASSLHVHVPRCGLVQLDVNRISTKIQPILLGYRLRHLESVRRSGVDAPHLSTGLRTVARALAACVPNSVELQAEIIRTLNELDEDLRAEDDANVTNVLIEALLSYCHEKPVGPVLCHEIADRVEAIFKGRAQDGTLHPRAAGEKIRSLGIPTKRASGGAGRGVFLTEDNCRRIHRLAAQYGVPLDHEKLSICPLCRQHGAHI